MTKPLDTIIDRAGPVDLVDEHFGDQIRLLRDVVNYGSNLIPRCFEASRKDVPAVIILATLLKQVVVMVDGIEIQLTQAAVLSSHVTTRALYEAQLYIHWMLKSDTESRARHYYVWNLRRRRKWANRIIPGTQEHASFGHALSQLSAFQSGDPSDQQHVQQLSQFAQQDVADIDQLLNSNAYAAVNSAFDSFWNRPFDPSWHAPAGVRSIRSMADDLGLLHEYEVFYDNLSTLSHASYFKSHVAVEGDQLTFEPIRHLESIDLILRLTLSMSFRVFRTVLSHYRAGEVENFDRKYSAEWQSAFTSITSVNYTAKT